MAPTKRIDETGDDDGVESADLRIPDCANTFGVSHVQRTPAALASSSRYSPDVERTSSNAQRFQICANTFGVSHVQRTPAALASSSRYFPDVERTSSNAQRFQIWVMRGNPVITAAKTSGVKPATT